MWRHHPWFLALLLAPLLHGATTAVGQVVTGTLCCASLLLLAGRLENPVSGLHRGWISLLTVAFLLPLVPLPAEVVGFLSPNRLALAKEFPLDGETSPAFLTLSISPAYTAARLWTLLLCLTVFCLARTAAREPNGARTLTLYLVFALVLVAGYEVMSRAHLPSLMPGNWVFTPKRSAGTFANRNHFAGWIVAASLFASGWILRAWYPLQSARGPAAVANLGSRADGVFVFAGILFALALAILSGSRSGALALLVGLTVWLVLLYRRSRRRSRTLVIIAAAALVGGLLAVNGRELLDRLAHAPTDFFHGYPKLKIWTQSLEIFWKFPLFGTGWGTFRQAFDHYKTFGGDLTFFHAENDYVQLFAETGFLGVLACAAFLVHFGRRVLALARNGICDEPEAAFGALAALAALAAQASIEFIAPIPALALLAAALAGLVVGSTDPLPTATLPTRISRRRLLYELACPPAHAPVPLTAANPSALPSQRRVLFNVAWVLALGVPALFQALALYHWSRATPDRSPAIQAQHLRASLDWWPYATYGEFDLATPETRLLETLPFPQRAAAAETARARFTRLARLDPYNSELRATRVSFDLQHSANRTRTKADVFAVCRLNPFNELIPLNLARDLAAHDPDLALEIMWQKRRTTDHLLEYVELVWQTSGNAAHLWPLVTDTPAGMSVIANFALEKNLYPLAAKAWLRVTNQLAPAVLARNFLAARRPDLALELLPRLENNRANRLLAVRAHLGDKDYATAIVKAEALWLAGEAAKTFLAPYPASLAYETARADWLADQNNPLAARKLGEKIFQEPAFARDVNLLRTLAGSFPKDLRLTWMFFSTLRDKNEFAEAAHVAADLAARAADPN